MNLKSQQPVAVLCKTQLVLILPYRLKAAYYDSYLSFLSAQRPLVAAVIAMDPLQGGGQGQKVD